MQPGQDILLGGRFLRKPLDFVPLTEGASIAGDVAELFTFFSSSRSDPRYTLMENENPFVWWRVSFEYGTPPWGMVVGNTCIESFFIFTILGSHTTDDVRPLLENILERFPALGPEIVHAYAAGAQAVQFDLNVDEDNAVSACPDGWSCHNRLAMIERAKAFLTSR